MNGNDVVTTVFSSAESRPMTQSVEIIAQKRGLGLNLTGRSDSPEISSLSREISSTGVLMGELLSFP